MDYFSESSKAVIDVVAIIVSVSCWVASVMVAIIPTLASLVTLAWGIIRIVDWWQKRKNGAGYSVDIESDK